MSSPNPYSSPSDVELVEPVIQMDPADKRKLDLIIKDAGQFWLAIILCVACSAIAAVVIPFWYTVRLVQHSKMAKKYPALNNAAAPPKSIPRQFQSAKIKLIIGLFIGGALGMACLAYVGLLLYVNR